MSCLANLLLPPKSSEISSNVMFFTQWFSSLYCGQNMKSILILLSMTGARRKYFNCLMLFLCNNFHFQVLTRQSVLVTVFHSLLSWLSIHWVLELSFESLFPPSSTSEEAHWKQSDLLWGGRGYSQHWVQANALSLVKNKQKNPILQYLFTSAELRLCHSSSHISLENMSACVLFQKCQGKRRFSNTQNLHFQFKIYFIY